MQDFSELGLRVEGIAAMSLLAEGERSETGLQSLNHDYRLTYLHLMTNYDIRVKPNTL